MLQRSLALTAQLRQQAMQLAALESLSNALEYQPPVSEYNSAPMATALPGDMHSAPWQSGPGLSTSLSSLYAAGQPVQNDRYARAVRQLSRH